MIGNSRQLGVARRKRDELASALQASGSETDTVTYRVLIANLNDEIAEFEQIRDGVVRQFPVESVDELGKAVIKARVASGLNQRELADELGVSEQAVQKDEATQYERAGLARVAEILDALGHELVGCVRPANSMARMHASITSYPPAFQGRIRLADPPTSRQNGIGIGRVHLSAHSESTTVVMGAAIASRSAVNSYTTNIRVGASE